MRSIQRGCVAFAIGAAFTPLVFAQQAQSTNYQLIDYGLHCSGGGTASIGTAAWPSLGTEPAGALSSANYLADVGMLANNDIGVGNNPILFGLTPDFGSKNGGQTVTVTGYNLDKFGVGPSTVLFISDKACTGINVLSNTMLTAMTPANGQSGPKTVTLANAFGVSTKFSGFINTPAVITTPVVPLGTTVHIIDYGTVGAQHYDFVSTQRSLTPTPYGTFLIGPVPLFILFVGAPYPGPNGIDDFSFVVPEIPSLHGLLVHFQSFELTNPSPVAGSFTNVSSTFFP